MEHCYKSAIKNTIKFLEIMSLLEIRQNKVVEWHYFTQKKSELVNTCRHQSKLLLKSF